MKFLQIDLSEQDIIFILNSLSYFRNEIYWHDSVEQKRKFSMFFNFINNDEYIEQYSRLDLLHKRLSTAANHYLYNIDNDFYFEGQRLYLINKNFDFIDFNNHSFYNLNKNTKFFKFFKKRIDIYNKIV